MTGLRMDPASRRDAIEALSESGAGGDELDILVIGGGVTGAGIAMDAASRGLTTGIVEAQDWASGTSSRSSKLLHGGLRYLQMLDFKLVHEALTERDLLLTKLVPHLVRPVPFLYPLKTPVLERAYVGAGIMLYDLLAMLGPGRRRLPWHRHFSRKGLRKRFPSLRRDALAGAIQYWDASVDDARLVTTLMRSAAGHGAHAASRVQVTELVQNEAGAVVGANLIDLESGRHFTARAKKVISATGVWTEETQQLAGAGGLRVLASKGIHIVVPRDRLSGKSGLILQTEKSVLFVIPWSRYWLIGTTDTPWNEDRRLPVPTSTDIDYVIAEANKVLEQPISRADVVGTWAGLRPLLQPGTKVGTASAKVSREHTVASPTPGLVSIAGGKLTTYRVMAEDAVDFALGSAAKTTPSVTATTPLVGAVGSRVAIETARALARKHGLAPAVAKHLVHRYGAEINVIAAICDEVPGAAVPVAGAPAYIRAEIIFAARYEGALHLDDVMERRTRMSYEFAEHAGRAAEEVAEIVAAELGWSPEQMAQELATYRANAAAYDLATHEATDAAAVARYAEAVALAEP
ncbi:glycerol-3-phosphate dehydrogenase/oxidase [Gulosibacter sediminis]|uniref:glycerol-3-phosphate dehydrogenase/oxidase n=1 Tax=Gulosibacter sediminis TaxID=1729695 RepID=UPI0024A88444|nr:glycerol-3-phosphate dehydrogenase/oxidase [Gulosibacter sediminis]